LTKKTLDRVIAEKFPRYEGVAMNIAWNSIYNNIKDLPTAADVKTLRTGAVKMELTRNEGGAEIVLGRFGLRTAKDDSLVVFKNSLEAPTDHYWGVVGKFKPY